jgi:uncharacterized protein (TIGR02391 family)
MARYWDYLEILKVIHGWQEATGVPVPNGWQLLGMVTEEPVVDSESLRGFVRELELCEQSALLELERPPVLGGQAPPSASEPNSYLVVGLTGIALTPNGRDRAIGRVVCLPGPIPGDDGAPIARLTLLEIAGLIEKTYDATQIDAFLEDSGLPRRAMLLPGQPRRAVVPSMEQYLLAGLAAGSEIRTEFRRFLGAWLSNQLHTGPDTADRERIVRDLARQGWHVRDGWLVRGERTVAHQPAAILPRDGFTLHPVVAECARPYLASGHNASAVAEAVKLLVPRVRELSGLHDEDGQSLMGHAFGGESPRVPLNTLTTPSDRDEQDGFKLIFMGTMTGVRNPKAHALLEPLGQDRALDYLGLVSLLMRRLDDAQAIRSSHLSGEKA